MALFAPPTLAALGLTMGEGVLAERLAAQGFKVTQRLPGSGRSTKFRVREARGDSEEFMAEHVAKAVSTHGVPAEDAAAVREDLYRLRRLPEHPHVLKHRASFLDGPVGSGAGMLYLVTPFAADGDLGGLLAGARKAGQGLPQPAVLAWVRQALRGLQHLHESDVVHRCVATSKIYLLEGRRRACLASPELPTLLPLRVQDRDELLDRDNRNAYLAPELVQNAPCGRAADLWALGCVYFELCTLALPFTASSLLELPLKVLRSDPDWSAWSTAPAAPHGRGARDAVERLLRKDPRRRPTASEMLAAPLFADAPQTPPSDEMWESLRHLASLASPALRPGRDAPAGGLPTLLSNPRGGKGGGKAEKTGKDMSADRRSKSKVESAACGYPAAAQKGEPTACGYPASAQRAAADRGARETIV